MTSQKVIDTQEISTEIDTSDIVTEDDTEEIPTELDISHIVTEDNKPVDNFQSEEQQRLLVEPLYISPVLPRPFLAAANVGLFYQLRAEPIVPDAFLSLGVQRAADFSQKKNRSYFVWEFGKVPDVCIEVVSNKYGNELTLSKRAQAEGITMSKKDIYALIGVRYYVVFDPLQLIQREADMNGALLRVWVISPEGYTELTSLDGITDVGASIWLNGVGLGLTLWLGEYEESISRLWLRWCDQSGQVIPTGTEAMEIQRQLTETERQLTEAERQRAESEHQRAEAERQRAESEHQHVMLANERVERLADRLRSLGVNPDEIL
jgi:Uma2 family endonuclease